MAKNVFRQNQQVVKQRRFDIQLLVFIICGIGLAFALGHVENRVSSETATPKQSIAQTKAEILPVDVNAVLNSDYSTVIGTWKSDTGASLAIDSAGQLTFKNQGGKRSTGHLYNARIEDGRLEARFEMRDHSVVTISFLPAGTPTKYTNQVYEQDAVLVSSSMADDSYPYYRQENKD